MRFAPDGRVFVAEKTGRDQGLRRPRRHDADDRSPTSAPQVHHFWDRGLLGLALDPDFPAEPFVYVLYTYDAPIGGTAPRWGTTDVPRRRPGRDRATAAWSARGCRACRLSGNQAVGDEQVLIEDWCQQCPSHSIGDLALRRGRRAVRERRRRRELQLRGLRPGRAARATPAATRPPAWAAARPPPTAEGGALRSQDLRTAGDPTGLDGSDPAGRPGHRRGAARQPARRQRRPRRAADRRLRPAQPVPLRDPAGHERDRGSATSAGTHWEEINRVADPADATVENFGWPCYEGDRRQGGYDVGQPRRCARASTPAAAVTSPVLRLRPLGKVVAEETCPAGSSSISGWPSRRPAAPCPAEFDGALFFADYVAPLHLGDGARRRAALPSPSRIRAFRAGAAMPVGLQFGPGERPLLRRRLAAARSSASTTPRATRRPGRSRAPRADQRRHAARRHLRRLGLERSRRRRLARLRLGPRRRRRSSTTPRPRQAAFTYTDRGRLPRGPAGHRQPRRLGHRLRWRSPPGTRRPRRDHRLTHRRLHLEGRRPDRLRRRRHRHAGRRRCRRARSSWSLVLDHCPSNCHEHALQSFDGVDARLVRRSRPRVPVLPRAAADRHRQRRPDRHPHDPARPEDRRALASRPARAASSLAVNGAVDDRPVHPHGDRGVGQHGRRAHARRRSPRTTYDFSVWSDDGARTHTITAGAPATYTATFTPR